MSTYRDLVDQDFRLVLLRALADETDNTSNEAVLQRAAELYGHSKSRDYVRAQLRWLEDVGAVSIREVSEILIATLAARGLDHVERRVAIDGIGRPSLRGS